MSCNRFAWHIKVTFANVNDALVIVSQSVSQSIAYYQIRISLSFINGMLIFNQLFHYKLHMIMSY